MKRIKSVRLMVHGMLLVAALVANRPVLANQEDTGFSGDAPMPDNTLSDQSGQGGSITNMALVSGNTISVNGNATLNNGNNVLGDHALDNISGISSVIQNSGNNVVIQNSTIVNVSFQ